MGTARRRLAAMGRRDLGFMTWKNAEAWEL
jgi:hypothetical protein